MKSGVITKPRFRRINVMTRSTVMLVVAVAAFAATVVGAAYAQDQDKSARREKLRQAAGAAIEAAAGIAEQATKNEPAAEDAPQGAMFKGRVVLLEPAAADAVDPNGDGTLPISEINAGGLVVLVVPDTQSHPTKFKRPAIEPAAAFRPMGRVRGIRTSNGKPMMGGGYTWLLLKAMQPGDATITVAYTPNGGDGEPVVREHKVKVTE